MKSILIGAAAVALVGGSAVAGAPPDDGRSPWAKPYAGRWTLAEDGEGGAACTLRLTTGMAIGGAGVVVPKICKRRFPVKDVAAWTVYENGDIGLIDPLRRPVLRFHKTEAGPYVGETSRGRRLVLSRFRR
jgi:hypothetical protein